MKPDSPLRSRDFVQPILKALVALVVLFAVMFALDWFFGDQVESWSMLIYEWVGIWGILGIMLINEIIIFPLPADALLIIVVGTNPGLDWLWIVSLMGLMSSAGGWVGWLVGDLVKDSRFTHWLLGKHKPKAEQLMEKYGIWAVVLAATTVLPWNIVSVSAGMLKMRFLPFFWVSLLRIPRFMVHYLILEAARSAA